MLDAGQHNLSIALRHLLQQIVDSTTPSGHKHTDMSLPHDGYTQKLSWYFECEKCNYKAFYSHDMEDHKQNCSVGLPSTYQVGKKRKLVPPKRVTSSTHPPNTDSDHDSERSFTTSTATHARPLTSSNSAHKRTPPVPQLQRGHKNVISMEPQDVEFETTLSSPDRDDIPIIPANEINQHSLDFDQPPPSSKHKNASHASASISPGVPLRHPATSKEPDVYYNPIDDFAEIKIELDGSHSQPPPALQRNNPAVYPTKPTDHFEPTNDPNDALMSTFSTGDRTSTSMPGTSSQLIPGPLQTYTPPELAIGNVTSLKKSLTGPPAKKSPAAASNPGAKIDILGRLQSTPLTSEPVEFPGVMLNNERFLKEYCYSIKNILQHRDLLTSRNLQRGRFLPRGTCNGRVVTSAAIGHHFLERLELMGFGKRRTIGKKHVFQRHYWDELNFSAKEKLNHLGITSEVWVNLVLLQNSQLLGEDYQMAPSPFTDDVGAMDPPLVNKLPMQKF